MTLIRGLTHSTNSYMGSNWRHIDSQILDRRMGPPTQQFATNGMNKHLHGILLHLARVVKPGSASRVQ